MPLSHAALAELRRLDEAAGVDPATPSRTVPLAPPAAPPEPLVIERPDWEAEAAAEAAERRRAELAARAQEVERLAPEDVEALPAKPRPKPRAWWRPDRGAAA